MKKLNDKPGLGARALLAQWLERAAVNRKVTGSIPVGSAFIFVTAFCIFVIYDSARKSVFSTFMLEIMEGQLGRAV